MGSSFSSYQVPRSYLFSPYGTRLSATNVRFPEFSDLTDPVNGLESADRSSKPGRMADTSDLLLPLSQEEKAD